MSLGLDIWSANIIGYADNTEHKSYQNKLVKKCESIKKQIKSGGDNWISNKTFNSLQTYNLLQDNEFKKLHEWVFQQVREYSMKLKYQNNFTCSQAWFNIYNKNDYQEYHNHSLNALSAVYFLKSNTKSSKIHFRFKDNPGINEPEIHNNFNLTAYTAWYKPIPGRLLIFKADLLHCVERSEEKDNRISIAYNFDKVQNDK